MRSPAIRLPALIDGAHFSMHDEEIKIGDAVYTLKILSTNAGYKLFGPANRVAAGNALPPRLPNRSRFSSPKQSLKSITACIIPCGK
jgi:hypothetical protein